MIKIKIPNHNDYGKWLYKNKLNSLFIMGNHKFALYSWMLARKKYDLNNSTLLHFDYHYDYAIDSMAHDFVKKPSSKKALSQACFDYTSVPPPNRIMHDNFIPAAIGAGLFNKCVFICKDDEPSNLYSKINGRSLDLVSYASLDAYLDSTKSFSQDRICLDIDLDYFNNSEKCGEVNLDDERLIVSQLCSLKHLSGIVTTTIAVSEDFSGGVESSKKLLQYIKNIWDITDDLEGSLDVSDYADI